MIPPMLWQITPMLPFKVVYNAFEQRDIIVSFRTPDNSFIAQGRTTIDAGTDTATIVFVAGTQAAAQDYIFITALRPVGGKYGTNIKSQTKNADIVSTVTAVPEIPENNYLKVFPNPAHNLVYFHPGGKRSDFYQVEVYSIDGNLVYTNEVLLNGLASKIDVSNFPAGVYILKIKGHKNSTFLKTNR